MKRRFFISAILFLFVFSGFTHCYGASDIQESLETCVTRQWPHELSDLAPDSDIVFGRLDNGFRYVLKKNQQPKGRTAILLDVDVGSLYELDEESGIAHFLEHMVFNGSTHFKPGELVEYFQDIGMSFGGDTNAYTTYDNTVYKIILPSSEKKMLEEGLLVMRDYARGALLAEAEIDRERGVILSEMNERNTASYRIYKQSSMFTLDGTLLPKRFAIGRKDVLERVDRTQMKRFYDKWYRPENMTLVMVGDLEIKQAEEAIIRQFSSMKGSREPFSCPEYGTLNHSGIKSFYYHEPDLGHTSVSIGVLQNKQPENDSFSLQVKNLHRYMAARILNFRLDQEREDQDSIFSSARFSINSILDHYQHSAITAATGGENWKEALAGINRILNQAIEYGFTGEETAMVQDELISYLERAVQTKDSMESLDIARNIVSSLNNNRVVQSAVQEERAYTTVIKNTTEKDLHEALLELWNQDVRLVEVIGDARMSEEDPKEIIGAFYRNLQKEHISPRAVENTIEFPYLPPTDPVEPVNSVQLSSVDATRYFYANGTVLNLKKTAFKENSTSVAIHFGTGEKSLPKGGLSHLSEAVVNGSGTATLRESELSRALAGSSAQYRFGIGDESLRLAGSALSTDIETLFQLFQSILRDPGLRPEAYQAAMKRFDLMYKGMGNDINGGALLYLAPFFAGNNVTHGMVSQEEFRKLTLDDVKKWILPQFADAPLEITVVGDFEQSTIVELVSKYF
ncbi:MAG: insulinase family protein, partial [Desulfocapsaceae bacterium]|nr:insulinase family protein [Desulfocapsaceae bacterium]